MRIILFLFLTAILFIFAPNLSAQDSAAVAAGNANKKTDPLKSHYAKGLQYIMPDSSFAVKVGFRFQTLLQAIASSDNINSSDARLMVRRSRLKFDGYAFSPDIIYKAELALSNSDIGNPVNEGSNASNIVLDAVLKWRFMKNTTLWFGQTKLPGNRERVISSQALQFVDRSNLNSDYNIDRDLGFQLHHQFKIGPVLIRDIYAISTGEGRNITADNRGGLDYTTRLEFLPFGAFNNNGDYVGSNFYNKEPKLSIAATYDYNQGASKQRGQLGDFLPATSDLHTVFADLMFVYRRLSVMAEYADKRAKKRVIFNDDGSTAGRFVAGTGLNVQAGYLFTDHWEIAGRYTEINSDRENGRDDSWMYTLGLSYYKVGHNLKVQLDLSLLDETYAPDHELMFRLQTELAF